MIQLSILLDSSQYEAGRMRAAVTYGDGREFATSFTSFCPAVSVR